MATELKSTIDCFFAPKSVAVIGASQNNRKAGHTVLKNLKNNGYDGKLFAINPKYDQVESVSCYPNVASVSQAIDLAIICTPADTVVQIVKECCEAKIPAITILTAGFAESGKFGSNLQSQIKELVLLHPDTRIIGPNCVGLINTQSNLNASFACGMPERGRVSFVSQSGALCTSVLDWAIKEHAGFANFVSIGNMVDVGWGQVIDYLADDPNTDSLILYIESVKDANIFLSAAHRCSRLKPIIALKAGRFKESAEAAASHTGALAAEDVVYDAVFRRIGIQRVFSIQEMFDAAELLSRNQTNTAGKLAIVSNAGGPAVMATDTLIELGGELAELSPETIEELDQYLPRNWSRQNPVDVIGDATPERLAAATKVVLQDTNVESVLVVVSPQTMTDPTQCAFAILEVANDSEKTILTSWMGGNSMTDAIDVLNSGGLPTFPTPERAVRAFVHLSNYVGDLHNCDLPWSPITNGNSKSKISGLVTEVNAKGLLADYGIESVPTRLATSREEAVDLSSGFDFPCVVKIASPEISHKSDIGAVKLNLRNQHDVASAFDSVIAAAHRHCPQEIIMGASVQPMIDIGIGYELIAGIKRDPVFGPVIMIGTGGINAEVFQDTVFELPPINEGIALGMIRRLKSWPILNGFRGQPVLNSGLVADVLCRLFKLAIEHPEIKALDINPLLVTPDQAIALDARIVLMQKTDRAKVERSIRKSQPI